MFCGALGKLTKEHAWPQWMHAGTAVGAEQHSYAAGFQRSADDTMSELPNVAVHHKRSVLTTVVREFCTTCNSGWMSRLETRCKPLLKRLWAPSYPFGSTSFSGDEVGALASWAVKTAWVRERVADRSNVAGAGTRELFARSQTPPPNTWVWVSRYAGAHDFGALSARMTVSHQDQNWATGETRKVYLCALRFQGLAMVVRTDSGPGVPPFALPADAWRPLQADSGSVSWPPARAVGDYEVESIVMNAAGWLRLPQTTNFVPSGDWEHVQHN